MSLSPLTEALSANVRAYASCIVHIVSQSTHILRGAELCDGDGDGDASSCEWIPSRLYLESLKHCIEDPSNEYVFSDVENLCQTITGGDDNTRVSSPSLLGA